jgi:hypothetical protein
MAPGKALSPVTEDLAGVSVAPKELVIRLMKDVRKRMDVATESRVTLTWAITKGPAVRHAGTTI